jgi:class 3 adenylate cyclase
MRVPRTFVFVDLSAFTDYTAVHGDDAAGRILANFRMLVREVTSEHGIRIAKWLGDGAMIVALDHTSAIAAALEMEDRATQACAPLSLRVGMASGLALLFEGDDYIGSAVNLAARLCDLAGPFEVLIPADQAEPVPDGVTAIPHGALPLKGFRDPVEVTELSGRVSAARHDTEELWTRNPFAV